MIPSRGGVFSINQDIIVGESYRVHTRHTPYYKEYPRCIKSKLKFVSLTGVATFKKDSHLNWLN
jgi:hypothetical protein